MYKLSSHEEFLCKEIVDAAFIVHSKLGPGVVEKIYEVCFCHELRKKGISFRRQVDLPIYYDDLTFDEGLRLDVLVDDLVVCELKAMMHLNEYWTAQTISNMKLAGKHVGFLINFHVPLIKQGIRRFYAD
ncbi:GxxExxY protein [Pollutibacter soli]|uniref:GxxExxY protein n=1 Tax=Pollutibacter soli TaxID=3034157 RepID=UPI003013D631